LAISLDGLSGGTANDASTDSTTPADTGIDVSLAMGADAAADVDGSFCAHQSPTPTFCTDFDELPVGYDWTSVSSSKGEVALDDAAASSPPNSARMARTGGGCAGGVGLAKLFKGPLSSVHVQFKVRPTSIDGGIGTYLGGLKMNGCVIIFDEHSATEFGLAVQGTSNDYIHATRYPLLDLWTPIDVDITSPPAGGTPQLVLKVAGATAASGPLPMCSLGGDVTLDLGPSCSGDATELHFDDVAVTAK
jgi:hypothetical protein